MYSTEHTRASAAPKPLKALMNLTTRIDSLTFNHDAQLCAMASKRNKDALRLVHVPSQTVFANWPTGQTPLSFVQCCAFTPSSGTELGVCWRVLLFFSSSFCLCLSVFFLLSLFFHRVLISSLVFFLGFWLQVIWPLAMTRGKCCCTVSIIFLHHKIH